MKQRALIASVAIIAFGAVGVAIALGAFDSDAGSGSASSPTGVSPGGVSPGGGSPGGGSPGDSTRGDGNTGGSPPGGVSPGGGPPGSGSSGGGSSGGGSSGGKAQPRGALSPGGAPRAETAIGRQPAVPTLAGPPRKGRFFEILELRRGAEVSLRAAPGGEVIDTLGARTEFGSPRALAVARQRGSWMGVITPLLDNGEIGWVRFDGAKLERYWTRYWLRISLAKRELQLRYGGREIGRYTVSVGAAGTDTPRGRFAITDALAYDDSPYYGCCALALSGHQERLPVDWLGGDRIAIHGTPGPVGYAASHGCIRATDATMHTLFRRIPLGTPVFVRG
jgi:L,D-transpeptidase catalytic domain